MLGLQKLMFGPLLWKALLFVFLWSMVIVASGAVTGHIVLSEVARRSKESEESTFGNSSGVFSTTADTRLAENLNGSFITVSTQDLFVEQDTNSTFLLFYKSGKLPHDPFTVTFNFSVEGIISPIPNVTFSSSMTNVSVVVHGLYAGHVIVTTKVTSDEINVKEAFVRITVVHYKSLIVVSAVVGWIYFVAWTVAFWPQLYRNWRRKSVVGLSFDLVYLNLTGFILYCIFNIALFWIPEVQHEYFSTRPQAVNPVQSNDVGFTIYAVVACCVAVVQCCVYERGDQKISRIGLSILGTIALCVLITCILAAATVIQWLTFLNICSAIKLVITVIKYMPQVYLNFRRKSTVGWSIGNALTDFTGGIFSIIQMVVISYNYNDWTSIFGDFTKFGLGLFTVIFDILFMVQHYILYKGNIPYAAEPLNNDHDSTDVPDDPDDPDEHDAPDVPDYSVINSNTVK